MSKEIGKIKLNEGTPQDIPQKIIDTKSATIEHRIIKISNMENFLFSVINTPPQNVTLYHNITIYAILGQVKML